MMRQLMRASKIHLNFSSEIYRNMACLELITCSYYCTAPPATDSIKKRQDESRTSKISTAIQVQAVRCRTQNGEPCSAAGNVARAALGSLALLCTLGGSACRGNMRRIHQEVDQRSRFERNEYTESATQFIDTRICYRAYLFRLSAGPFHPPGDLERAKFESSELPEITLTSDERR